MVGGMHGKGMSIAGWMDGRGHAWQGDVHSRVDGWLGACMAGCMHGGVCVCGGSACMALEKATEEVVRILLECILVCVKLSPV